LHGDAIEPGALIGYSTDPTCGQKRWNFGPVLADVDEIFILYVYLDMRTGTVNFDFGVHG
jgi:hypothetical protein